MSIFKRVKNIVISNLNFGKEMGQEYEYTDDETPLEPKEEIKLKNEDEEYYKVLEVEYGADFKKIKAQYKKLLKKYHPDFYGNDKDKYEKAVKLSKKINEAYSYFERKYS